MLARRRVTFGAWTLALPCDAVRSVVYRITSYGGTPTQGGRWAIVENKRSAAAGVVPSDTRYSPVALDLASTMSCKHCRISAAQFRCGQCQAVGYCGAACARADWGAGGHALACGPPKRKGDELDDGAAGAAGEPAAKRFRGEGMFSAAVEAAVAQYMARDNMIGAAKVMLSELVREPSRMTHTADLPPNYALGILAGIRETLGNRPDIEMLIGRLELSPKDTSQLPEKAADALREQLKAATGPFWEEQLKTTAAAEAILKELIASPWRMTRAKAGPADLTRDTLYRLRAALGSRDDIDQLIKLHEFLMRAESLATIVGMTVEHVLRLYGAWKTKPVTELVRSLQKVFFNLPTTTLIPLCQSDIEIIKNLAIATMKAIEQKEEDDRQRERDALVQEAADAVKQKARAFNAEKMAEMQGRLLKGEPIEPGHFTTEELTRIRANFVSKRKAQATERSKPDVSASGVEVDRLDDDIPGLDVSAPDELNDYITKIETYRALQRAYQPSVVALNTMLWSDDAPASNPRDKSLHILALNQFHTETELVNLISFMQTAELRAIRDHLLKIHSTQMEFPDLQLCREDRKPMLDLLYRLFSVPGAEPKSLLGQVTKKIAAFKEDVAAHEREADEIRAAKSARKAADDAKRQAEMAARRLARERAVSASAAKEQAKMDRGEMDRGDRLTRFMNDYDTDFFGSDTDSNWSMDPNVKASPDR